jgi:hypothetical protein
MPAAQTTPLVPTVAGDGPEPGEDDVTREYTSLLQQAVDEQVAPLHQTIRALQQRIAELEGQLAAAAAAPAGYPAPSAHPAAPATMIPPAPFASAAPPPVPNVAAPAVPDLAMLGREFNFPVDRALDGQRRHRRVVATVALVIALTMGGFLAALVYSWVSLDWREGRTSQIESPGLFVG